VGGCLVPSHCVCECAEAGEQRVETDGRAGVLWSGRSLTARPQLNALLLGRLTREKQWWRMIEIAFLLDHPDAIPTLTQWFRDQWPEYYAARSREDIAQDFYAEANRDGLPVRLLAFMDEQL
jgi:hypothetical protein